MEECLEHPWLKDEADLPRAIVGVGFDAAEVASDADADADDEGTDNSNGVKTNGVNGVNGVNGINGVNGFNGVNGHNGVNGCNGTNGSHEDEKGELMYVIINIIIISYYHLLTYYLI